MTQANRHFNTFLGDPVRALLSATQNEVIKRDGLIEHCATVGDYLENQLITLQGNHPEWISNVRGRGTFLAFDVAKGPAAREKLVTTLKQHGVNAGVCGIQTFRLRPSLYFGEKHADILTAALADSIK